MLPKQGTAVILMTACINPCGMEYTALQDCDLRRAQYVEALKFYLNTTNAPIVFIENSNNDLSDLFQDEIQNGRLEMLVFDGNNYDRSKGKGFGEAILIEYGIRNSQMLKCFSVIIKVTGRLKCHCINTVLAKCNKPDTMYTATTKDGKGNIISNSQLFVFNIHFWRSYFFPLADKINDSRGVFFEHVLYRAINNWRQDGFKSTLFWFPLNVEGVSGSYGEQIIVHKTPTLINFFHSILHWFGYNGPLRFWKKYL